MPQVKYRIFELSARAVMSYATKQEGRYQFCRFVKHIGRRTRKEKAI